MNVELLYSRPYSVSRKPAVIYCNGFLFELFTSLDSFIRYTRNIKKYFMQHGLYKSNKSIWVNDFLTIENFDNVTIYICIKIMENILVG